MGKVPRRHHWLSRFYLAGFTEIGEKNGRLHVTDMDKKVQFQSSPSDVAVQRDFNVLDVPELQSGAAEEGYAQFEDEVAPVLRAALESETLPTGENLNLFLNLVALFGVRNPRERKALAGFEDRLNQQILAVLTATRERWEQHVERLKADGHDVPEDVTYDDIKSMVDEKRYDLVLPTAKHVQAELKAIDTVLPYLAVRNWGLLVAPDGSEFVCSDSPLAIVFPLGESSYQFCPGFGILSTELTLPLSKRVALLGRFEAVEPLAVVDATTVASVNGRTVTAGLRFVYSGQPEFTCAAPTGEVVDQTCFVKTNA